MSFVLSIAVGVAYLAGALPTPNLAVDVATTFATAALIAFIAAKVGSGRNWARWLFMAIYVFGFLMFALLLTVMPQEFTSMPTLMQISALVQLGLQTCALVLMFTRTSRQWFTTPYGAASASAL